MSPTRPLVPGVWCPVSTFYTATDDIDTATIGKHVVRLASAGITGIVTLGSYGEGPLLMREEKSAVNRAARRALDAAGFAHVPVISGVTEQSVKSGVAMATDAAVAGADAVLVVAASYFRSFADATYLKDYFTGIADGSPVPVIIYNFPGVTGGIDMSSELLLELSTHPNIVGTKFTCGNSGKLARVAGGVPSAVGPLNPGASVAEGGYMCIAGMADFLTQALSVGGAGVISGPANIVPKTVVRVYKLFAAGNYAEAFAAQRELSRSDYELTNLGPEGTKLALERYFGYGGHVRRPMRRVEDAVAAAEIAGAEGVAKDVAFERSL
ncbi:aldolase [Limtongia smithiae]|uniref:aldolase n=1 Tax=Limtongia smithiae TaxID=1125753 RepID=UPI0034CE7DA7